MHLPGGQLAAQRIPKAKAAAIAVGLRSDSANAVALSLGPREHSAPREKPAALRRSRLYDHITGLQKGTRIRPMTQA